MSYSARIPTVFNMEVFSDLCEKATAEMNRQNLAIASGFATNFWAQAPEKTRTALTSNCAALRSNFDIESAAAANSAMIQRDTVYKQMKEILIQFKGMCTEAHNTANGAFAQTLAGIEGFKDEFIHSLNTQDAVGNYLFSGAASNISPVDMTKYVSTAAPNMTYYQGSLEEEWPTAAAPFAQKALWAFEEVPTAFLNNVLNFNKLTQIENMVDDALNDLNFDTGLSLGHRAKQLALDVEWLQNMFIQSTENYSAAAKTNLIQAVPAEISLQQQASLSTTTLGANLAQMSTYAKKLLSS